MSVLVGRYNGEADINFDKISSTLQSKIIGTTTDILHSFFITYISHTHTREHRIDILEVGRFRSGDLLAACIRTIAYLQCQ